MDSKRALAILLIFSALTVAGMAGLYRAQKQPVTRIPAASGELAQTVAENSTPGAAASDDPAPPEALAQKPKRTKVRPAAVKTPAPAVEVTGEDPRASWQSKPSAEPVPAASEETPAKTEPTIEADKPKAEVKPLDLSEELATEAQVTQPVGELETEVTVKAAPPPEQPAETPPLEENPEPALPAAADHPKEDLLDQLTVSPYFGYRAIKTNRASNGQGLQLSSKLSPGLAAELRQNWSSDFSSYGQLAVSRYSFEEVAGVSAKNMTGATYSGAIGGEWSQSNRISVDVHAGLAEDFAVAVDSSNALEPVKYSRPEAGTKLSIKLLKTEKGALTLAPKIAYVLSGSHSGDKTKAHAEYGLSLGFEKKSQKLFQSTGAEIDFSQSKLSSTQGRTTNTSLGLRLNFSFGY